MMILSRLQFGHKLGYDKLNGYQKALNKREPIENMFGRTSGLTSWIEIQHAIEVFGIDHVLYRINSEPVQFSPKEHINIVCNNLGISVQDQNKILGLIAQILF